MNAGMCVLSKEECHFADTCYLFIFMVYLFCVEWDVLFRLNILLSSIFVCIVLDMRSELNVCYK